MTANEARLLVVDALERSGRVVYEQRQRQASKGLPQLIYLDPHHVPMRVRVTVLKVPRTKTGRGYLDRRYVDGGAIDMLAVVHPDTGEAWMVSADDPAAWREGRATKLATRPVAHDLEAGRTAG